MTAIVTDKFRILNAENFLKTVTASNDSYYIFVGLPNPSETNAYGRTPTWNSSPPSPIDSITSAKHIGDTCMFGKKISSGNIRRIIRRIDWVSGKKYEMYRDDYSILNPSPLTNSFRLYNANYYVMNEDYRVYICIDNGSSGTNVNGNVSEDQPTFTDLEPSRAGSSGDGYIWKYLFTVSPSDIVKFDSTEYITLPSNWGTTTDTQITLIRENGDSTINKNQIKKVYIENGGDNYFNGFGQELDIIGDGTGGKVRVDVVGGEIVNTIVTSGGSGYSYAMVDLGPINSSTTGTSAKLIPIIPPSRGHGYDIYSELGADKILIYGRLDDTTKDFPTNTVFSQVGILKNPSEFGSENIYDRSSFSSLSSIKFSSISNAPQIGEKITQVTSSGRAVGYVASYDPEVMVIKYFTDRSLFFNQTTLDQTDYVGISTSGRYYDFEPSANLVFGEESGFSGSIDTSFSDSKILSGSRLIDLGSNFTQGLSSPEINKGSGDLLYIDNRPIISRNPRQKEDIKIILEF